MSENSMIELPRTGERFIPEFEGDIVAEHYHRYLFARDLVAGKTVLDIACGEGYGSHLMAAVATHVTGVDIDVDSVNHARRCYVRDNLTYREGDCTNIPLPDASVDIVVSFETIEHHDRHQAMLEDIKRVLRPGGLLIISSPDKHEYSDVPGYVNPYHVKELYRDEFTDLLNQHFKHHAMLGQRVVYGSLIGAEKARGLVSHNYDDTPGTPGLVHAVYLIALASDGHLPEITNSLFQHDIATSDAVQSWKKLLRQREVELEERGERVYQHELALERYELALERSAAQNRQWLEAHTELARQAHTVGWLAKQLVRLTIRRPYARYQHRQQRQQVLASEMFDADWYLAQYPDIKTTGLDPLDHYLQHGGFEGRDPSPWFKTDAWLMRHPWLVARQQHPLLHYLEATTPVNPITLGSGGKMSQTALFDQLFNAAASPSSEYAPLTDDRLEYGSRVRAIAFYLPQFHPIEENDRWWGKGFTEWTNVSKAVPQFEGHYQPRHPGELGYYDLRLPQVQERQVELARQHGLEAFCFHYYWFSGRKRLLERPIDQYVANPNIDFPFCLCWANENWTRRWDGQEHDVLMEQRYEPQDDLEFIEDVAPLLRDPRYLRVAGKPLLIVYRVDILPDAQKTARVWREYCREQGIGELHLVAAQSFGIGNPHPYGFDAAVEFPPHDVAAHPINNQVALTNPNFAGAIFDYADIISRELIKPAPKEYRLYRSVFPAWDNEARKPGRGHIFAHSTPDLYRQWLAGVCDHADRQPGDEKLVFINAWNEWAEGAYLEPDRRYGYAYLQATQQTLAMYPANPAAEGQPGLHHQAEQQLAGAQRRHATAVILHLHYPELWAEMATQLAHLEGEYDLYISLPEQADPAIMQAVVEHSPEAMLLTFPNRGRDIAPFLTILKAIRSLGYQQVLKIHAKKSLHREDGNQWRQGFLSELLGSTEQVRRITAAFKADPRLGLVGPAGHWLAYRHYWGYPVSYPAHMQQLKERLGVETPLQQLHFFAGSMFWCHPRAFDRLIEALSPEQFDEELGQVDGTLAHEVERLLAGVCQSAGLRVADTANLDGEPAAAHPYAFAQQSPPLPQEVPLEQAGVYQVAAHASPMVVRQQKLREWAKRIPGARRLYRYLKSHLR